MVKHRIKAVTTTDLFSLHFVPTIIVFLVMMILIGFSWRTATEAVNRSKMEQVEVRSNFVEASIQQRMRVYNNILQASSGLFAGSDSVTRNEWFRFVDSLDVSDNLPAILGVSYIEILEPSELDAYTARVRAEGFPEFNISPLEPTRTLYTSTTYIEPFNGRNRQLIGTDLYTEEIRREAMDNARDSGDISLTNATSLLQNNSERQNGVGLFHPLYEKGMNISTVEERRQAIKGFIYIPLRSDSLFGDIFEEKDNFFNFQIYDGTEINNNALLYTRLIDKVGEPFEEVKSSTLVMNGQPWTIIYSARPEIVSINVRERPRSVSIGGTMFSLLIAGFVYLLLQRRTRRLADRESRKLENAKDNMLSLASHQLRTPATGVKQYLGMVLEGFVGDLTQEQKEMLSRAHESNERQLRIINDFLYMAKADAGRMVITPQKLDLGLLTKQIVSDLQTNILEAGHTVKIKHRTKTVSVMADPHSARMILENLVNNAVKYTPPGGKITITISHSKGFGSVSIEDNGVGIDRKDFKKLFKQFSRIPNELTRQESGSGIGLYLSKYLAELNGGDIVVESERHAGSIFTVLLPTKTVKNITVSRASKS